MPSLSPGTSPTSRRLVAAEMVDLSSTAPAAQASKRTSAGYVSAFPEEVLDRQGARRAGLRTTPAIGQGCSTRTSSPGTPKPWTCSRASANSVLTRVRRLIRRGRVALVKALEYSKAAFGAESGGFNELAWACTVDGERGLHHPGGSVRPPHVLGG